MRVKAKIINYYCRKEDDSECFDNCNRDECLFCEKEYVFIDKDYKKCTFYEDVSGKYYLKLGNKTYIYDELQDNWGCFTNTIFEYVIIDDKLVFGSYKDKNIQVAYGGRRYNTEGIVIEGFILKSKIQEKIEELKKYGNNLTEEQRQKETEFLQGKLKAYEELLED